MASFASVQFKRRLGALLPLVLPATGLLFYAAILLTFSLAQLTSFVSDDTYYYLRVAQNVVQLGRFTFDGIHATSGFHPLWELILTGVAAVASNPTALLYGCLIVNGLLVFATGLLLYYYICESFGPLNALIGQALWSLSGGLILFSYLSGMENVLFSCLLVASLLATRRLLRRPPAPARLPDPAAGDPGSAGLERGRAPSSLLAAALFVLTFLARTDSLLLLGLLVGVVLLVAWRRRDARLARQAGVIVAALALGTLAYFAFNYAIAGHPLQVSGSIKSWHGWQAIQQIGGPFSVAFVERSLRGLYRLAGMVGDRFVEPFVASLRGELPAAGRLMRLLWVIPLAAFVAGLALALRRRSGARVGWASPALPGQGAGRPGLVELALLVYAAMHAILYVTLFDPLMAYAQWYIVPEIIAAVVFGAALLYPAWIRVPRTATPAASVGGRAWPHALPALLAAAILWASLSYWYAMLPDRATARQWDAQIFAFPRWIRDNLPADARIAAWDTGFWAYFSGRRITNLDGLMNDYTFFQDYLKQNRLNAYLDDEGIVYLIVWDGDASQCRRYALQRCLAGEVLYRTVGWNNVGGENGVQLVHLAEP